MYSMIRADIWKKAFDLPVKFMRNQLGKKNVEKFDFFASDEIQINMYLAFAGKSKLFPNLLA